MLSARIFYFMARIFLIFIHIFYFLVLFHLQWGPYKWKTYKEVYGEVLQAGSALRGHGFEPVRKKMHIDFPTFLHCF